MRQYQLAIFDLDGTLLNSLQDLATACNRALSQYGYEQHPLEAYRYFVGSGIYKLIERAMPEAERTEEKILQVKSVFDAYYSKHSLDETKPYEGILTLLKELKEAGLKTAVLSNKAHAYTQDLVERFFGESIDYALGQREGVPVKPDPEGVFTLLEYFHMPKEACIYIGDSNIDMLTAQNADLTSVGVLWGFREERELKEVGAHYLAQDVEELKQIILSTK